MKLKVIGSSSKGNGYALIADDEILLIEAGCKLIEVKKAIDWQIGKVVGCLVSHRHGDHAAHIKEYMKTVSLFTVEKIRRQTSRNAEASGLNRSRRNIRLESVGLLFSRFQ